MMLDPYTVHNEPAPSGTVDVDVLVIGAGAAGLVAGIAAHEAGSDVAIVDAAIRLGGNTALSSGAIPGAGTRFQRAAGIEDSPQRFAADLLKVGGQHDAADLSDELVILSAYLIEWLVDVAGVDMTLITGYRHIGHSTARLHAPPSRRGADLHDALLQAAGRRGISIAVGNRVTELLHDGEGRVTGARVTTQDAADYCVQAGATILATNGFAANRELLAAYAPAAVSLAYAGAPGSTGDALRWGETLGAATANLAAFQAHGSYAPSFGAPATWTLVEKGGVIVDGDGRRIGDESVGYSAFADAALGATGPLHVVFDVALRDLVAADQIEFAALVDHGSAILADDIADLAQRLKCAADNLDETLSQVRDAKVSSGTDDFGRTFAQCRALTPPYCAVRIEPALFHTQGGLAVDSQARVKRAKGGIIEGLYAAGGAAAGISGRAGASGYMSGNGLLAACGLGLIAGRAASAAISCQLQPAMQT